MINSSSTTELGTKLKPRHSSYIQYADMQFFMFAYSWVLIKKIEMKENS